MKRLLVLAMVMTIIAGALIFSARRYGEAHPKADQSGVFDLFERCGNRPCFMGIIPGETTLQDALKVLAPYVAAGEGYASVRDARNESSHAVVGLTDSGVSDVSGYTNANLGEIIQEFGAPCGVSLYATGPVALYYEETIVEIDRQFGADDFASLAPDWPISRIDLIDPRVTFTDVSIQRNPCHIAIGGDMDHEDSIWLGFASIAHYQQYAIMHPRS